MKTLKIILIGALSLTLFLVLVSFVFYSPSPVKQSTNIEPSVDSEKINENIESQFEEVEVLGTKYYTMRKKVKMSEIKQFFTENYPKIFQKIAEDQLEMTGVPRGIYYTWDEASQTSDMAAAIPVSVVPEPGKANKKVDIGIGEAEVHDSYIMYAYRGDYSEMGAAHEALGKACGTEFKQEPKVVMEEYVTDPSTEPDNSKWLTRIYYVLK